MRITLVISVVALCIAPAAGQLQTYSNGPLITHPGAGPGGANVSALEGQLTLFGAGSQSSATLNNRTADDFTVPLGQAWVINSFSFFTYQTGSTTTPTITAANYRIWSGRPGLAGSVILNDFSASNQLTTVTFTGIYRAAATTLTDVTRPIMKVTMSGNSLVLNPGTYWFDFQAAGTLASGPWIPVISIPGQVFLPTGNAVQFLGSVPANPATNGWGVVVSGTASQQQGFPFEVEYAPVTGTVWDLTMSQPGPGAPLVVTDSNGAVGNIAINLVSFNAGNFPNGTFFGIDIDPATLAAELSFPLPLFVAPLNVSGSFTTSVPGVPPGVPIYHVGIQITPTGAFVSADAPALYVTI